MQEEMKTEYREVPQGQLYLESVERAAMTQLVACIEEKDFNGADRCVQIMERLSIV